MKSVALCVIFGSAGGAAFANEAMLSRCLEEVRESVYQPDTIELLGHGQVTVRPATREEYLGITRGEALQNHRRIAASSDSGRRILETLETIYRVDQPDLWSMPISFRFTPRAGPDRTTGTICSINLAERHAIEDLDSSHKVYLDGLTRFDRVLYRLIDDF